MIISLNGLKRSAQADLFFMCRQQNFVSICTKCFIESNVNSRTHGSNSFNFSNY